MLGMLNVSNDASNPCVQVQENDHAPHHLPTTPLMSPLPALNQMQCAPAPGLSHARSQVVE